MQRQLKGGISMKKFRVHHILCTVLYRGEGYSGTFCDNMTQKVQELKADQEEPLMLVTDPDMICTRCPNRTPDDTCVDDKNHVKSKDLELLELFGLKENQLYSYRELLQCAEKKLDKENFLKSCGRCRWYQQGLCSYEEWLENARKILNFLKEF
jgi:hypothetical protein